ncbi:MAG: phage portal protein [Chloroflexota bacterium]
MSISLLSRIFGNNPLDDRYYETGSGVSLAGVRISADTALRISVVYRCVSIVANTLAMLPLGMYEELDRGRQRAKGHPLDAVIGWRPNRWQTSFEWRRLLYTHLLLRGNAYCQILPGRGGVGELVPLHPDRVTGPEVTPSGEHRYVYQRPSGEKVALIGGTDLWHLQGLSQDGLRGLAMVDLARDSFGLALGAEQQAATSYARGLTFQGILTHEGKLKPETAAQIGDTFTSRFGGVGGTRKVPVLWEGMKFTPVSMTSKDAEFLDSRKFTVTDIARWFGVPPHMVGDVERSTSWGTGIEVQGLGFLIYTLQPTIELTEQSIRRVLVYQPERFYPKFNVAALLRADSKTQMDVFSIGILNGIYSPNECRELLDRNPRDGGDDYLTPNTQRGIEPPRGGGGGGSSSAAGPDPNTAAAIALAARLADELDRPEPPAASDIAEAVVAKVEATEQARGEAEASDARARALATWAAGQVLEREAEELRGLSEKAGGSTEKWRHAVASFYGRHATLVALALNLTGEQARGYCRDQQETVAAAGCAVSLEAWMAAHLERLVSMAAAGKGGPGTVVTIKAGDVNVTALVPSAPPSPVEQHAHLSIPMVIQAPAPEQKNDGPQEDRIVGEVATRVTEMPVPPEKEVEVVQRDVQGRIKRTRETTKKKG